MNKTSNHGGGGDRCYYDHGCNKHKKGGNMKSNSDAATSTYTAPTVGLTKVPFTFITNKDTVAFVLTKSMLAQHVGTQ